MNYLIIRSGCQQQNYLNLINPYVVRKNYYIWLISVSQPMSFHASMYYPVGI